ncbi:MAG: DNA mismatch repair endonuclease MutL [Candidatus Schekmanbacteria bacterium]|nr:DNA mismatch repair endonuclease MutL [Candidatus Schekmanbacteria bacterium]
MNKIRILPDDLINQIAAGEVVERPASVIKELVENSIDAGATIILIKLDGGGKRLIEVADNGSGMSPDDALLSIERHATSKLKTKEDLGQIASLGFRGEALPSIASVSKMRITTSLPDAVGGCRLEIEGGRLLAVKDIGAPAGTVIEIRDLFYNTPARLKFLKTQATELSHIYQTVTKLALAYPTIHFKLTHSGNLIFDLPAQIHLRDRIASLFASDLARQLLEVDFQQGALHLGGLIAPPVLHRSARDYQYSFVNHRAVQNRTINLAAAEAYRHLLPVQRQAAWFLFLKIPYDLVDVNVHPAKLEVRFRNQQQIYHLTETGIKETLKSTLSAPQHKTAYAEPVVKDTLYLERIKETLDKQQSLPNITGWKPVLPNMSPDVRETVYKQTEPAGLAVKQEGIPFGESAEKDLFWQNLIPIGQLHQTYLLCQNRQELVIIDQHAAHERVMFEHLVNKLKQQPQLESQRLLFPIQLQLNPKLQPIIEKYIPALEQMGFELTVFGGNSLIIQAAPPFLTHEQVIPCLEDIFSEISDREQAPDLVKLQSKLLERLACHAAVRANQSLAAEEISALIKQLGELEMPLFCPHGRPTIIRFGVNELAKRFNRI